jgi:hypothetical protein
MSTQDPEIENLNKVEHFLALASRGLKPAASGGERRAAVVARLMVDNLDEFTGLDADAMDGLVALLRHTRESVFAVEEILERAGFRAPGKSG